MNSVIIKNISKGNTISENGYITTSFLERLKGLLGKKELKENECLIISPCNSIHMFFMKFEIDVLFIDKNNKVCHLINEFKPWKISKVIKESKYVIELKSKTIASKNIKLGDEVKYIYK